MTIWWDVLFYGVYYPFAIYAFVKGREWIRDVTIFFCERAPARPRALAPASHPRPPGGLMLFGLSVILSEEWCGAYPTPHRAVVFGANAPFVLVPLLLLWRMARSPHPFSRVTAREVGVKRA